MQDENKDDKETAHALNSRLHVIVQGWRPAYVTGQTTGAQSIYIVHCTEYNKQS